MELDDVWKDLFSAVKEEEWNEATVNVDTLIKKNPSDPDHFAKLGDLHAKGKKTAEALSAYSEAVRLYREAGATGKAMLICKSILDLDRTNAVALKELKEMLAMPAGAGPAGSVNDRPVHLRIDTSKLDDGAAKVPKKEMKPKEFFTAGKEPAFLKDIVGHESLQLIYDQNPVKFKPGDEIIREGESGDSLFIIVSGRVEVSSVIQGKKVELAELEEGDTFGEMAFLTSKPRSATVTAITDVMVLELNRKLLDIITEAHPRILRYFYSMYTSRMDITMTKLKESGDRLSGNFRDISLPDLLQVFDQSKKGGILFIIADAESGSISFRDGLIMDASFGDLTGEDALAELFSLKQGVFRYEPGDVVSGKIAKPITFVLMECIRLIDEKLLMKNYIPGPDRTLVLQKVHAADDSEMKAVIAAMQGGASGLDEIRKVSGLSRIRAQLALARLAKAGAIRS